LTRKKLITLINVIRKREGVVDQFKKTIKKRRGDPTDVYEAFEPSDGMA